MEKILHKLAKIVKFNNQNNAFYVEVLLDNGNTEILIIDDNTKIYSNVDINSLKSNELEIGSKLEIYYYQNTPTMLSEPPKYSPLLIMVISDYGQVNYKLAYFDQDLVSEDKSLKINERFLSVVKDFSNQDVLKEILGKRYLLIVYQASTKSIPALVDPLKVIMLS